MTGVSFAIWQERPLGFNLLRIILTLPHALLVRETFPDVLLSESDTRSNGVLE